MCILQFMGHGRPDMALFVYKNIVNGIPIEVYKSWRNES